MSSTVCVTDTSVIPFPTLGSTYLQTSNSAAEPLVHIPCRNARSSPAPTLSDMSISDSNLCNPSDAANYALQSRSATYVRYDSGSSSSSSTPSDEAPPTIIPRSRRGGSHHRYIVSDNRDIFPPISPASTPVKLNDDERSLLLESQRQTPLRDPSDDEDAVRPFSVLSRVPVPKVGKLRLEGSTGKLARHASDSDVTTTRPPAPGTPNTNSPSQTIRKKSGQPVKSSLKSSRRPELHVVTNGSYAKSEPVTPTHTKAVHFDSKLEHVKLFLAGQKPLAVSRDGSPTTDTDGEDFPSFIYGNGRRDEQQQQVKMLVPNMPSSPRLEDNIALQELVLSQEQRSITGSVRVRNIAYEKWVAVRFTMDWWQTTSEVTARYDKSIEGGTFDVFSFAIRLNDIWSRIDEKTIFVALRYAAVGMEFWDNNAGNNYHVKFNLAPPLEPSSAVDNETSLKDLDSKLKDVAKARSTPGPASSSPYRLGRSFSADHQYSSFAKSLSGRYDFASAYKTQRTRSTNISPPPLNLHHVRTHTYPTSAPASGNLPWSDKSKVHEAEQVKPPVRLPPLSLGSIPEGVSTSPSLAEAEPVSIESPTTVRSPDGRERNHRRGYVDRVVEGSPHLRRTPPGSPLSFGFGSKDGIQLPRTRSYPCAGEKSGPMTTLSQPTTAKPLLSIQTMPVNNGASGESTPRGSSQSSSSSLNTSFTSARTPLLSPLPDCSRNDASYKQFIDQFCFYTGSDSFQELSEGLSRSHSTSSIEHYLLPRDAPQNFNSHARPTVSIHH